MTAHTPGPWTVDNLAKVRSTLEGGKGLIADVGDGHYAGDRDIEQCRINAHLIAAAPELLAALQALFDDYKRLADSGDAGNWTLEELDVGKQALAALAKPRGQA